MSNLKNKLQHLVEGQIPEFLRVSYPRFASFIKEYYTFLDENRQANAVLLNSNTWSDVDLTLDMFAAEMRKQHAYDISPEALVEERRLVKFINQYYEAKGTENAAELYFRMMYNDTATIKYPGDFVLRASDGVWSSKKTIKIDTNYSDTIINPSALELAPAPIREDADDAFSLKEKTVYLKYYRRESTGLKLYSYELGCIQVGKIITNKDIFELEVDVPRTTNIENFNEILSTQPYLDTVWVTAFEDDVEYVYGFLTQQLIGYNILSGGEGFRLRDTFVVEVEETPFYPITTQQNNNGIVRVTGLTTSDVEEYFASDYVVSGSEYAASDTRGIINNFNFISTGHRFDVTGDYFAELYMDDDSYTTYKDFTRRFENPRGSRFSTLVTGDYFAEREGVTAYMEFNDENGYTDFNEDVFNISTSSVEFQVGYVYEHPGEWKNNAGFISDVNKLQDNYYYQAYSYVVQTKNTPYEVWGDLYNNSAHPAGFAVFGELLIENEITFTPVDITSTQFVIKNFTENVQPTDTIEKTLNKPVDDFVSVGNSYAPDYFLEIYTEGEDFNYELSKFLDDSVIADDVENVILDVNKVNQETIIFNDSIEKIKNYNFSDNIIVIDGRELTINYLREFAESSFTIDLIARNFAHTFVEVVLPTDTTSVSLQKNIVENIEVSESLEKTLHKTIDFENTYSPTYFSEQYVSENITSVTDIISIVPNYNLNDVNTVVDSSLNIIGKNISDVISSTDILTKTFTLPLQDDVVVVDTYGIFIQQPKNDFLTVDDDFNIVPVRNAEDISSVSDNTVNTIDKTILDIVSVLETPNVNSNKPVSDTVEVEDVASIVNTFLRETNEIIEVNDFVIVSNTNEITENILTSDAQTKQIESTLLDTPIVSEQVFLNTSLNILGAYSENYFAENYTSEDVVSTNDNVQLTLSPVFSEIVNNTDEVLRFSEKTLSENLQIIDNLLFSSNKFILDFLIIDDSQITSFNKPVTENLTLVDASSSIFESNKNEQVVIQDNTIETVNKNIIETVNTFGDTVNIENNKAVTPETVLTTDQSSFHFVSYYSDTVQILDVTFPDYSTPGEDSASIVDEISTSLNTSTSDDVSIVDEGIDKFTARPVNDLVTVIETTNFIVQYQRQFSDLSVLSDVISITHNKSLEDSTSSFDSITKNLSNVLVDSTIITDDLTKDMSVTIDTIYSVGYFGEIYTDDDMVVILDNIIINEQPNVNDFASSFDNTVSSIDKRLIDTSTVTEIIVKNTTKNVAESLLISEQTLTNLSKIHTELSNVTDTVILSSNINIADGLSVNDTLAISQQHVKEFVEQSNAQDIISNNVSKILSDAITNLDSISNIVTQKSLTEAVISTDSIVKQVSDVITDVVLSTDNINITTSRNVFETISVSDNSFVTYDLIPESLYNNEDYFECNYVDNENVIYTSDIILVKADTYVAQGYVDVEYAGVISTASDSSVVPEC
jgi:hypothetical protein